MNQMTNAERAGQAGAQRYDFPTVKLSYVRDVENTLPPKLGSSRECYKYLEPLFADCLHHYEEFHVLLMNRANEILGTFRVGSGGLTATVADPRLILQAVILSNCSSVILAHNHPSGQKKASPQDISLTKRLKQILDLLDINLLDHVIVTGYGYYSMADDGLI